MRIKDTIAKINFRNIFLFISWSIVICFFLYISINAVEVRNLEKCKAVSFKINHGAENFFIDEEDLKNELVNGKTTLIGKKLADINFNKVERNLDKNVYVEKAVMYKSVAGNIVIEIEPKNPIVRVCANNGMNYYVSDKWKIMPLSYKYTKKVILITGDITNILSSKNERDSAFNIQIKKITNYIVSNQFWSSMVDQIHVDEGKKIRLITSIIEPSIIFGAVDNKMEMKFKKVEIFLRKCLPIIQENKYVALDISYKNQVIGIKNQIIN